MTTREPEFDREQADLLRAHEALMRDLPPHGVPRADAMDPANAFKFVSKVETDFAAQTLKADQDAYYELHDKDPKHPINRSGHLWSVRLQDE